MSKKRMSAATMKFLEERKEIERQHLEYLRESRRAYMEKERAARDRATISGYDFTTGTAIYSAHGSAATYDLPAPTTDAAIKYLTLEEAMKLHMEEETRKYYKITREDATKWVKHGSASWMETGAPVRIEKNIRVAAMSDGAYPEVGMRVVHDGVTFEIERIEIETPSWRPVAVGHAVGDMDTFVAGRLYVRAPLDELQPAEAEEKVA